MQQPTKKKKEDSDMKGMTVRRLIMREAEASGNGMQQCNEATKTGGS
jgi:hypothetical protein